MVLITMIKIPPNQYEQDSAVGFLAVANVANESRSFLHRNWSPTFSTALSRKNACVAGKSLFPDAFEHVQDGTRGGRTKLTHLFRLRGWTRLCTTGTALDTEQVLPWLIPPHISSGSREV